MKTRGNLPRLSVNDVFEKNLTPDDPRLERYFAMYSSVLGGIVTDPRLMTIPFDDHMVHRGDGVFETMAIHHGRVYQMDAHLDRLKRSALIAGIEFPLPENEISDILLETASVAQSKEAIARIFISRGTGGFSVNPKECRFSHLYVVITNYEKVPDSFNLKGMRVITSNIPARKEGSAQLKNCNYMPNAMMELEAANRGADSAIALDEDHCLAEGSNKNVAIVTKQNEFITPGFQNALQGTTLTRALDIAQTFVEKGDLLKVKQSEIKPSEAYAASEMMFLGTTFLVVPIVSYDEHSIGNGEPGTITKLLLESLERDMQENEELLTSVPYSKEN